MHQPYDERTSPCDPEGKWFDEGLVEDATRRYRDHYRAKGAQPQWEEIARQGRVICDQWARERGFTDFDAAQAAGGTYKQVVASFGDIKRMPLEPGEEAAE